MTIVRIVSRPEGTGGQHHDRPGTRRARRRRGSPGGAAVAAVSQQMWRLMDRPGEDAVMAGVLQEIRGPACCTRPECEVTAVDIEPASEDVPELRPDTAAARVGLATAAGTRHVLVSAGYGLALAAAAGAPVRVADAVMDRLAARSRARTC